MTDVLNMVQEEIEAAIWGYLQLNSGNINNLDLDFDDIEDLSLEDIEAAFLKNATINGFCEGCEYWVGQMEKAETIYAKINDGKTLVGYEALREAISDSLFVDESISGNTNIPKVPMLLGFF